MVRRLGYTAIALSVLLTFFWALRPSMATDDDSSMANMTTIELHPPKALAQTAPNFPTSYAGMAMYVKHPRTDFATIQSRASSVGQNIKKTDGTSYVWITITAPDRSWPVYELYADTSGWVVLFMRRYSSVAYMLSRHTFDQTITNGRAITSNPYYIHTIYDSFGSRGRLALERFRSIQASQLRWYHFAYPSATAITVAAEHTDSMAFVIPSSLRVQHASYLFWDYRNSTNSLTIDGKIIAQNVDADTVLRGSLSLGAGRHTVEIDSTDSAVILYMLH